MEAVKREGALTLHQRLILRGHLLIWQENVANEYVGVSLRYGTRLVAAQRVHQESEFPRRERCARAFHQARGESKALVLARRSGPLAIIMPDDAQHDLSSRAARGQTTTQGLLDMRGRTRLEAATTQGSLHVRRASRRRHFPRLDPSPVPSTFFSTTVDEKKKGVRRDDECSRRVALPSAPPSAAPACSWR